MMLSLGWRQHSVSKALLSEQLWDSGQLTELLMPQAPHLVNGNKVVPTS